MDRKERQKLRFDLVELIMEGVNDDEEVYYERLLYALHIISEELNNFGGKN